MKVPSSNDPNKPRKTQEGQTPRTAGGSPTHSGRQSPVQEDQFGRSHSPRDPQARSASGPEVHGAPKPVDAKAYAHLQKQMTKWHTEMKELSDKMKKMHEEVDRTLRGIR